MSSYGRYLFTANHQRQLLNWSTAILKKMFYYFLLARNAVLTRSQTHTGVIRRWPITSAWITRVSSILFFFDDKFSVKGRKSRSCRASTGLWKRGRKRKTLGHKKGTRLRTSEAPERIRQPGGSTENDDRPLFPPSGLNYCHPAEHCLLWRRIILLSLGRPGSNALGGDPREGDDEDRREVRTGNRVREERPLQRPRFHAIYRSCERKPQAHRERPMMIYPKESISPVNSLMIHLGSFSANSAVEMAEDKYSKCARCSFY